VDAPACLPVQPSYAGDNNDVREAR
jgi:hypothetical protein